MYTTIHDRLSNISCRKYYVLKCVYLCSTNNIIIIVIVCIGKTENEYKHTYNVHITCNVLRVEVKQEKLQIRELCLLFSVCCTVCVCHLISHRSMFYFMLCSVVSMFVFVFAFVVQSVFSIWQSLEFFRPDLICLVHLLFYTIYDRQTCEGILDPRVTIVRHSI